MHIKDQNIKMNPKKFALIIGAMKCGTTSLYDILSQHPQICPSKVKEPDYFTRDAKDSSHADYLSLWEWDDNKHSIALESSVAYTKAPFIPNVPKRIKQSDLGDFRFIYMLRNPFKRIESHVRHGLFAGWGDSLDHGIAKDVIDFTRYSMQIEKYLEYFPRDSILLLTLEGFKSNPDEELKKICDFLEIDNTYNFANVHEPRNTGQFFETSPLVAKITQGKIGQFIAQNLLSIKAKNRIKKILINLGKRKNNNNSHGRWKLNDDEKRKILEELAEDLSKLETTFEIDVRKLWNLPQDMFDK